jgi:16S rRNA (cytosine1402-N4)-methyltransferase
MAICLIPKHKSVLTAEMLEYLNPQPGKTYLDVTFGTGGHTRAILEKEPTCTVIAIDWDAQALETYGPPLQEEFGDRLRLVWGNFSLLYKIVKKEHIEKVDGIIADFGTSQVQILQRAGFSIYRDTPLDMRMSPSHQRITAAEIINTASEEKLCEIFWQLGEETRARPIVRLILQERIKNPITTTGQLVDIIERVLGGAAGRRVHPATKVFQALRIYVNKELDNIHAFLSSALKIVRPGGNLVCITFHSLEDRVVKQFFKEQELMHTLSNLTPKGIVCSTQELHENASARSARLRAAKIT